MTVSSQDNKITYSGDGSTTFWSFDFPGVSPSDIVVFIQQSDGEVFNVDPAQYNVVLADPVAPNPTGAGGNVEYPIGGSPLPPGDSITIYRQLPLTQDTSIANQSILYQTVIEAALDYIVLLTQQLNEVLGRTIQVDVTDPALAATLPPAILRANQLMGFDADGNPTIFVGTVGNVTVSPAMLPVVTASTTAVARTALGVGAPGLGLAVGVADPSTEIVNFPTIHRSSSFTITVGYHMSNIVCDGLLTINLPAANTVWNGFGFFVYAKTHSVAIQPVAGDAINVLAAGQSYPMPTGADQGRWVRTDGVNLWFVTTG